jgi:hypothetical protein
MERERRVRAPLCRYGAKHLLSAVRLSLRFFKSDAATPKEIGVDATIGDRIELTPKGGDAILAIVKPSTSLLSAVQFPNAQLTIYADYRRIDGVLYPFRITQGADAKSLSVFQASDVALTPDEPSAAPVTRPALPIATPAPSTPATQAPSIATPAAR